MIPEEIIKKIETLRAAEPGLGMPPSSYPDYHDGRVSAFDEVLDLLRDPEPEEEKEVQIGTLNKAYGIKGYVRAEVGHPVFELKDRYIIYLKHPHLPDARVPFYKDAFKHYIDFAQ